MTVSKETKEYVIDLLNKALIYMRRNQFEDAEDYIRSAYGELRDSNKDMPHMGIGTEFDVHLTHSKLKFLK